jgi:glucokinase
MFLGIEIGGSKLQLGVGSGQQPELVALERVDVPPGATAVWIRDAILPIARRLVGNFPVKGVGVGFGGPIDPHAGVVVRSHQIAGWEGFPLAKWLEERLGLPTVLGNDADCAGLAEAVLGAGRGCRNVFYTNVGSGIGGAIVIDGRLYTGSRGIAGEIGHLCPGLDSRPHNSDVEMLASGWAIGQHARRALQAIPSDDPDGKILREVCRGEPAALSARHVAEAASLGCRLARQVLQEACQVYGWAIAQAITLLAPEVVVVGGGVALMGEELWFRPLRMFVDQYVFPPLRGTFRIVPAALGQEVVIHGAITLARQQEKNV